MSQGHQFIGCGSVGEASPIEAEKSERENHNTWTAILERDDEDIIWEPPTSDPSTPGVTRAVVHTTVYGLIAMLTIQGHSSVQIQHHNVTAANPPSTAGAERFVVTSTQGYNPPVWVCRRKRDASGQDTKAANWSQVGAYISKAKLPNKIVKAGWHLSLKLINGKPFAYFTRVSLFWSQDISFAKGDVFQFA